jgi:protein required for attachment to host cells
MQIDQDALVMVVDGRKMLMFRNRGDEVYPQLEVEEAREQDNPPTREQGSDAPGRNLGSAGGRGGGMEQTDFHRINEERFAADAAALLRNRALANEIGRAHV